MAATVKENLKKIWSLAGAPHWTSTRRWEIEGLARDAYRELDEIGQEQQEAQRRMAKPQRTIPELAKEVLEVQNACNLSGVVLSWAEAIVDLRALCPGAGTDTINHHPINVMWAEKVAELTGAGFHHNPDAFQTVRVLAAGL